MHTAHTQTHTYTTHTHTSQMYTTHNPPQTPCHPKSLQWPLSGTAWNEKHWPSCALSAGGCNWFCHGTAPCELLALLDRRGEGWCYRCGGPLYPRWFDCGLMTKTQQANNCPCQYRWNGYWGSRVSYNRKITVNVNRDKMVIEGHK